MDIVIYSGFVPIVYHHQRDSIYQKGRKLYAAGHVHDLVEKCSQINGKVIRQTSVTAKPYSVELIFNTKREVSSAFCECIAGIAGYCKHISAVVIAINDEKGLSKTSYSCQWNKPSSSKIGQMKYAKGKKFEEMFELKKAYKKYDAVEPPFEQLRGINCMLSQMLLAEENLEANPKPSFDGVRTEELPDFSQLIERQRSSTLLAELNEVPFALYGDCCMQKYNTIIFTADVHKVCQNTFKDKVAWTKERKFRITASRCYGLYTFSKDWVLCNKAEKYFNVREFSGLVKNMSINAQNFL